MEKPVELESNTAYKRCHLCVRIFSTKANLRWVKLNYLVLIYGFATALYIAPRTLRNIQG